MKINKTKFLTKEEVEELMKNSEIVYNPTRKYFTLVPKKKTVIEKEKEKENE